MPNFTITNNHNVKPTTKRVPSGADVASICVKRIFSAKIAQSSALTVC
jgi:hypothetical protein